MAANTSLTLTQEATVHYEEEFLDAAQYEYIYRQGGQTRTLPANSGRSVQYTRHTPLALATTALTEGVNPSEVSITAANVTATLAEYGTTVKISRFHSLTSIDAGNEEKIRLIGQNMGETLDRIARTELITGATTQFANDRASLVTVAVTDVMNVSELRKAVRTLKKNKARKYQDRVAPYLGKLGPDTSYDLTADSTFLNADIYDNSATKLYNGELGRILGVRLIESVDAYEEVDAGAASADVFSNFIHGADAFGCIDLMGDKPQLHIIPHTKIDSGNPAGRFSLASWAAVDSVKVLNSAWIINVKSGATSQA